MRYLFLVIVVVFLAWTCKVNHKANGADEEKSVPVVAVKNEAIIYNTDPAANYANYCASCHGEQLRSFVDRDWAHGQSKTQMEYGIRVGYPDEGMPGFDTTFTQQEIADLADYILEGIKNVSQEDLYTIPEGSKKYRSKSMTVQLVLVADGLDIPWGMAFLPAGGMMITDKNGKLYRSDQKGSLQEVSGVPEVVDRGQGGLMDIELHPDFATNSLLYLSYTKAGQNANRGLSATAISRAKLQGNTLTEVELIFEALPYQSTGRHFGCRLEFDREGFLYFSVGDRGNRDQNPQSLDNHCGKIHRIHEDGRVPQDNPFVNTSGAMASIYSYGHRNPQGVAMDPKTGLIWTHEHGPRGGDEVNLIQPGRNYGWPVISYGINYSGTKFTDLTEKEGMEQPLLYWVPSIAPCGMAFVDSDRYPAWKGDLLVGSLRFDYIVRCVVEGNTITGEEKLFEDVGRVRNLEMGPDGYIYVAVENPGRIYRVMPVEN